MSVFNILDARTKLFIILLFTILVFLIDKLPVVVCLLFCAIIMRFSAKIPFRAVKLLKNLTLLALFIIFMQTTFGPGDTYIMSINGKGYFKWEGFILALVIICRVASLFILMPVFSETTPPHNIAAGLFSLGLNYRIAFIITTAFNFIPLFKEEALLIMDAQKLRGMNTKGIRAYAGVLVPLMLGAMRKAQVSSVAMDCRAFGIYKTRTWIDKPVFKGIDFCYITGSILFSVFMVILNYL